MIAIAATAEPTPIPAFAPELKPLELAYPDAIGIKVGTAAEAEREEVADGKTLVPTVDVANVDKAALVDAGEDAMADAVAGETTVVSTT